MIFVDRPWGRLPPGGTPPREELNARFAWLASSPEINLVRDNTTQAIGSAAVAPRGVIRNLSAATQSFHADLSFTRYTCLIVTVPTPSVSVGNAIIRTTTGGFRINFTTTVGSVNPCQATNNLVANGAGIVATNSVNGHEFVYIVTYDGVKMREYGRSFGQGEIYLSSLSMGYSAASGTIDIANGSAQVPLQAAVILPYEMGADQCVQALYRPYSLFEPRRIWVPVSAGGGSPTLTTSLSAAVQQAQALTAGLSAAVQTTPTVSASLAAAVQAARTAQAGLDAAVQQARTSVASVQAAVQAAGVQTASIDAALQLARSASAALDIAVQAQSAATASVSLQVQATNAATASLSLQVQAGSSASVALSVAVLQQALATAGVDLAVQLPRQQTASISAALQAARNAAAAIDMALQLARSAGASVNLQVQAGTSLSAGVDLAVQRATSAVASVQLAIAQSATASLSLGAAVMVQRSVGAAVQALILGTRFASLGLNLYIFDGSDIILAPGSRRALMPLLARSVVMQDDATILRRVKLHPR